MKLRGLVPKILIHVSVSDLCIPTIVPPILLQNRLTDRGNIEIAHRHECRNWERGLAVKFFGIFVSSFRYSVFAVREVEQL
jgi:hypothetical protein